MRCGSSHECCCTWAAWRCTHEMGKLSSLRPCRQSWMLILPSLSPSSAQNRSRAFLNCGGTRADACSTLVSATAPGHRLQQVLSLREAVLATHLLCPRSPHPVTPCTRCQTRGRPTHWWMGRAARHTRLPCPALTHTSTVQDVACVASTQQPPWQHTVSRARYAPHVPSTLGWACSIRRIARRGRRTRHTRHPPQSGMRSFAQRPHSTVASRAGSVLGEWAQGCVCASARSARGCLFPGTSSVRGCCDAHRCCAATGDPCVCQSLESSTIRRPWPPTATTGRRVHARRGVIDGDMP